MTTTWQPTALPAVSDRARSATSVPGPTPPAISRSRDVPRRDPARFGSTRQQLTLAAGPHPGVHGPSPAAIAARRTVSPAGRREGQ
jgi:hypothetical protein